MLLASIFLLCWDWDRLRHIIFTPTNRPSAAITAPLPRIEKAGYLLGAVSGFTVLTAFRGLISTGVVKWMLVTTALAIVMVLVGWVQAVKRSRVE